MRRLDVQRSAPELPKNVAAEEAPQLATLSTEAVPRMMNVVRMYTGQWCAPYTTVD